MLGSIININKLDQKNINKLESPNYKICWDQKSNLPFLFLNLYIYIYI